MEKLSLVLIRTLIDLLEKEDAIYVLEEALKDDRIYPNDKIFVNKQLEELKS